jgi:hypothetical protein
MTFPQNAARQERVGAAQVPLEPEVRGFRSALGEFDELKLELQRSARDVTHVDSLTLQSVEVLPQEEFDMARNPERDANKKAKREMQEAVDKVIDEKKKEPIGTKEAEEKVADDLNEAAHEDTKK